MDAKWFCAARSFLFTPVFRCASGPILLHSYSSHLHRLLVRTYLAYSQSCTYRAYLAKLSRVLYGHDLFILNPQHLHNYLVLATRSVNNLSMRYGGTC